MPIILGSASPRRKDIFDRLQIPYELSPADIDERAITYTTPRELALKAAYAKASAVEPRFDEGLIVAVDTIVVRDGKVYGKPDDSDDAVRMLGELNGVTHEVISGIAVKEVGRASLVDALSTRVHLRSLTPQEIEDYVATGEPLDKAGSYAAQGLGRRLINRIDGDYYNVVGLPVNLMLDMMDFFIDTSEFRCHLPNLSSG